VFHPGFTPGWLSSTLWGCGQGLSWGSTMRVESGAGALLRQAAVAVAYLVALFLFRQVSIPHWIILTGFHLAMLMLVPYRYWPALFIGDAARLAYISIACIDRNGALWAAVNAIPSIAYEAPVVWWFRERWRLFPSKGSVNMPALVFCSLIIAAIATVETIVQIHLTTLQPGYVMHYGETAARLMLGNFMGVLTITPTALVLYQSWADAKWRGPEWLHRALDSRHFLECAFFVLPALAFLEWIGHDVPDLRGVAQMAMFLPVVAMAFRHGWQGAAVTGTMASIGIVLLMPETNDPVTLQAETLVALAISTMLLVGARLSHLDRRAEQERWDSHMAMALAQRNAALGEAHLRVTAQALDQLRESINGAFTLILGRMRHLQPVADDTRYRRQVQSAQEQLYLLTDSLSPSLLRERGLPGALMQGTLARSLLDAGVRYWCDIRGPVSIFPQAMGLAIYRIVGEAVAEACANRDVAEILVKVRCGMRERPWMAVMIETRRGSEQAAQVDWETLQQRLKTSTTGMGRKAIEDRAATFNGQMRTRALQQGQRLVVSLFQPSHSRD